MASAAITNLYVPGLFRLPSLLSHPCPPRHISAHCACRRRAMGGVPNRDGKRCHHKFVRSRTLPVPITSVTSAPAASHLRSLCMPSARHAVSAPWAVFPIVMASAAIPNWYVPGLFLVSITSVTSAPTASHLRSSCHAISAPLAARHGVCPSQLLILSRLSSYFVFSI
jgi:hypothetical protein